MVEVPDVSNLRPRDAFDVLASAGLEPALLGLPNAQSDGNVGFQIIAQEPPAGARVDPGTTIVLAADTHLLSFGTFERRPPAPAGSPAPEVVGLELEAAMRVITDLGFMAVVVPPPRAARSLNVARQEPTPGERMELWQILLYLT